MHIASGDARRYTHIGSSILFHNHFTAQQTVSLPFSPLQDLVGKLEVGRQVQTLPVLLCCNHAQAGRCAFWT